jgi:hypothetical protein
MLFLKTSTEQTKQSKSEHLLLTWQSDIVCEVSRGSALFSQ